MCRNSARVKSSARPLFLIFLPTRSGGVCRASARPPPRSLSRAKQHSSCTARDATHRNPAIASQPYYSHCNTIIAPLFRVRHTALPLTGLRSLIVGGGPSQACCSRTACLTPAARSRYSRVGLTREHRDTSRAEPTRSASGYAAALQSARWVTRAKVTFTPAYERNESARYTRTILSTKVVGRTRHAPCLAGPGTPSA